MGKRAVTTFLTQWLMVPYVCGTLYVNDDFCSLQERTITDIVMYSTHNLGMIQHRPDFRPELSPDLPTPISCVNTGLIPSINRQHGMFGSFSMCQHTTVKRVLINAQSLDQLFSHLLQYFHVHHYTDTTCIKITIIMYMYWPSAL